MQRAAEVRFGTRAWVLLALAGLVITALAQVEPAGAAKAADRLPARAFSVMTGASQSVASLSGGGAARPTLDVSRRNLGTVFLRGRTAKRRARLVVQRRTDRRSWVRVQRISSRRHRFRVVVWKKRRAKVYRVVDRSVRRHSATRKVPRLRITRDACGVRPLKPSGAPWRCSFQDSFDGTTLDPSKWRPQTSNYATGTPEAFACYSADNVALGGGSVKLRLTQGEPYECPAMAEHENSTTTYTAGMVSTYRRFSQQYGRFEARIRNTDSSTSGLHEAFYLWPDVRYVDTTQPGTGEIDVSETYSVHPDLSIPRLHYATEETWGAITTGEHANTAFDCMAARGEFNTYRLTWSASRIEIRVNGKLCLTNTSGDAAFRERYIVSLTQAIGFGENALVDDTSLPATMEIDRVRVWH